MGVVFISNHVLEVKCVIISLLFLVEYDSLIYNHMKLLSDYSGHTVCVNKKLTFLFGKTTVVRNENDRTVIVS